jgi:hypothetical protein
MCEQTPTLIKKVLVPAMPRIGYLFVLTPTALLPELPSGKMELVIPVCGVEQAIPMLERSTNLPTLKLWADVSPTVARPVLLS